MRIRRNFIAASAAALLAACSHPSSAPGKTMAPRAAPAPAPATFTASQIAARTTLLSADSALSAAASTSLHDALSAGTDDSIMMLMPALARIQGRDKVVGAIDSLNAVTNRTLSWRAIRAEISADGTRGYTYGYGRRVARSDTLTSVVPIQYLAFWKRESDGWKMNAWLISAGGADAPATAPAACAHPAPPAYITSRVDSSAIATVRAADLDFSARSVKSGAGPAFGEFVAEDGASIGTGASEVACGRETVEKGLSALGPGALTWAPRVADAAPSGDLAFTSGDATIREGKDLSYSNYLTVWKRTADGEWRVVADGGNSAPAPAAP